LDVLFIHPNFPGQFLRVSQAFADMPGVRVFALGDQSWMKVPADFHKVTIHAYPAPAKTESEELHPYVRGFNDAVKRADRVLEALATLKMEGLEPDVIFTHPGWGDSFFLRDIFPGTRIIGLFEFFYNAHGADSNFDPETPFRLNDTFRIRSMNATQLMALDSCDIGYCPTGWQRSRFPDVWQQKLSVLHEGIDTEKVCPDPTASIEIAGKLLRAGDEVLTFASRNLEPYRGLHTFMRALPAILAARPNCQVIIVGGTDKGYGASPPEGTTFRDHYLAEVQGRLDMSRVHFTGPLEYPVFLKVLQVSRAHIYLTYPFVLSWSMLEAMSAGCLVIGSATPPVEEVIEDGVNGLLTPFHSPQMLAERVIQALANPRHFDHLRQAARQTIIERYDFATVTLPGYLRLLHS
jgi:glycosyltransferase involved in cell wall biosynthesis